MCSLTALSPKVWFIWRLDVDKSALKFWSRQPQMSCFHTTMFSWHCLSYDWYVCTIHLHWSRTWFLTFSMCIVWPPILGCKNNIKTHTIIMYGMKKLFLNYKYFSTLISFLILIQWRILITLLKHYTVTISITIRRLHTYWSTFVL